ncbi:unnamed protein product [Phaedon cochleariae]|uniref:Enoyl-CoA hydratase domain-containing protein 3, mitochondrial n=1 Tax=Phaedon cochleariae TaxID=80249 RepID=A0A9N9SI38_PHACE|nr:unnamed protein product [Phaedon cochleariae]
MIAAGLWRILKTPIPKELCNVKYSSTYSEITKVQFINGIKSIKLHDQKTRNSLSIIMMEDLIRHINSDGNNKNLRVIVLSADGNIFSAGHNLKELTLEAGKAQQEKVFQLATHLMHSIINCPVPVIAQVNGLAAAAGCQLVAQCDIAICTENSSFSTPGSNFGIFCSTPGVPMARKVLRSTSLNMLLTGLPISASEAKSSGLVTTVCLAEDLDMEVNKTCEAIKSKSRSVIELGKKFFYEQIDMDIKKAYYLGAAKMLENLGMEDGQEGIKSFVEKRKPKWSHGNY